MRSNRKNQARWLGAFLVTATLVGGTAAYAVTQDDVSTSYGDATPVAVETGTSAQYTLEGLDTYVYGQAVQLAAYYDAVEAARVAALPRASSGGGGSSTCANRQAPLYKEGNQYGGSSVPASIVARESGGDYHSQNCHSTASGRYQALDSTWDGYGGYARASDAPMEVQDAWAEEAFAAAGCRPWGGC